MLRQNLTGQCFLLVVFGMKAAHFFFMRFFERPFGLLLGVAVGNHDGLSQRLVFGFLRHEHDSFPRQKLCSFNLRAIRTIVHVPIAANRKTQSNDIKHRKSQ